MRRHPNDFAAKPSRFRALRVLAATLFAATIIAPQITPPALAYPTDSPSARAAARLKNRPPRNWIRHYLGEDRYKIAGGTWKFVSTELDRFYYPAYAPEMLRQSPNRVIGFSSAKDAQEAGYLPAPGYAEASPAFDAAYAGVGNASTRTSSLRVTLADGVSTAVVPAGWRSMMRETNNQGGMAMTIDAFVPGNDANRGLAIISITLPAQAMRGGVESFLSPQRAQAFLSRAATSGRSNSTQANALRSYRTTRTTLGGLRGVSVISRDPAVLRREGRSFVVGRGNKIFLVQESPQRAPGTGSLLSSLRLR